MKHTHYGQAYRLNDLLKLPERHLGLQSKRYFRVEEREGCYFAVVSGCYTHTHKGFEKLQRSRCKLIWHAFDNSGLRPDIVRQAELGIKADLSQLTYKQA